MTSAQRNLEALKKRILFVSLMSWAPWGGSEELWSGAAIRLSQKGCDVAASMSRWDDMDPAVQRLRSAGCRVYERGTNRVLTLALRGFKLNPHVWRAERVLTSERPDLVVISCGSFADDLSWCQACRVHGIPYVIILQAAAEIWWPVDVQARGIRSAYEAAQTVFFVSKANQSLVERMLAGPIPNGRLVRNPFNVDYGLICPYPPTQPTFNLACVGRLEPVAKGQDLLLEVLSQAKWRGRNLRVSFFGKGASAEGIQALSRFYGLDNVNFCGHTRSVQEIWKTHHILVLPSRYEGLPLALVEAMLCGRAALITNVAGNTEVLDDNETGFVAAAATVAHIDEAMERAWERRSDWGNMGAEAARRIRLAVPQDPAGVFADQIMKLAVSS